MLILSLALALFASYILGSFPTALIAGKIVGGIDIREHGSGNAGATNVYRLFGLKPYIATLSIDILKGYISVAVIAPYVAGELTLERAAIYCGFVCVAGHVWTIFARFKGGKGVATAAGVFIGVAPMPALIATTIYFIVTLTTKYVSLGSMMGALSVIVTLLAGEHYLAWTPTVELKSVSVIMAVFIMFTHRENIKRLLKGEERKTDFLSGFNKKD